MQRAKRCRFQNWNDRKKLLNIIVLAKMYQYLCRTAYGAEVVAYSSKKCSSVRFERLTGFCLFLVS